MTSMDQIHRIRDLYYGQDKSLTEIASMEKLDWRTVRKYVDMEDVERRIVSGTDDGLFSGDPVSLATHSDRGDMYFAA